MSRGEFGIFWNRPLSVAMLAGAVLLLVVHLIALLRRAQARRGTTRADSLQIVTNYRS
jgi:TctA family transporter